MKARIVLNLILFALVAALGLFVYFRPGPAPQPEFKLSTMAPGAVRQIRIERQDRPTIKLEKKGRQWRVTAPFHARANAFKAEQVLGILGAGGRERLTAVDLARFGLDHPLLTLTLNRQVFRFGGISPISQGQYVEDGKWVYLVAPVYFAAASAPAPDFASQQLLAANEVPVGFDFPSLKLTRVQGRWSALPARPGLDQDRLNQFAQQWRLATSLLTQPFAGGKVLEHIRVHLKGGRAILVEVIRRKPELVLRRVDENMEYHFPAAMGKRLLDPANSATDDREANLNGIAVPTSLASHA